MAHIPNHLGKAQPFGIKEPIHKALQKSVEGAKSQGRCDQRQQNHTGLKLGQQPDEKPTEQIGQSKIDAEQNRCHTRIGQGAAHGRVDLKKVVALNGVGNGERDKYLKEQSGVVGNHIRPAQPKEEQAQQQRGLGHEKSQEEQPGLVRGTQPDRVGVTAHPQQLEMGQSQKKDHPGNHWHADCRAQPATGDKKNAQGEKG